MPTSPPRPNPTLDQAAPGDDLALHAAGDDLVPRAAGDDLTLHARVDAALERIRPSIQADGGDVWLIKVAGDIAYVQMVGACGGCTAALVTLRTGIERVVREDVPEIRAVEQL
jgi:Fe-S cluster biogenesis protein NfuA